MKTTVVNIKKDEFDVNCGRPSKWGNPFIIGRHGDRDEVIKKHKEWFRGQLNLINQLDELKGKRIGCYCSPQPCHLDFLAMLADMSKQERTNYLFGGD